MSGTVDMKAAVHAALAPEVAVKVERLAAPRAPALCPAPVVLRGAFPEYPLPVALVIAAVLQDGCVVATSA